MVEGRFRGSMGDQSPAQGATSRWDGVLHALAQTPPFRKLVRAIDGAEAHQIGNYQMYFAERISKMLWGTGNVQRHNAYLQARREAKKNAASK